MNKYNMKKVFGSMLVACVFALWLGTPQFAIGQQKSISAQFAEGTPIELVVPDSVSVDVFFHILVDNTSKIASIEVTEGSEVGKDDLQRYELKITEEEDEYYLEGNWIENNRIRFPHTVYIKRSATYGFITIKLKGKPGVGTSSIQYKLMSL